MNGKLRQLIRKLVIGTETHYTELGAIGRFDRLLWFAAKRYSADRNSLRAVALTYYTLFAVVPMLALAFGIAKGFNFQEKLQVILSEKLANQREVLEWIYHFADTTLKQAQGGLIAGAGVVALLWTVLWLASKIEKSFNAIWNLPQRSNLLRRLSDYLSLILITPLLIVVLSSAGPILRQMLDTILQKFPLVQGAGMTALSMSVELFPLLLVCFTFSFIYFLAPNTRVRLRSAILGGIVAGVLFQLLQDGFIFIQTNLYRYNKIYGSFAVLPLFLIWLQWSWQIALFGAELSFIHQHIGSGLFDRLGKAKLSLTLRREYQLTILGRIYSAFAANKGMVPEETLFDELPLPQVVVLSMLDELVDCEAVFRLDPEDDERGYTPAHPTDTYTICDALRQLENQGLSISPTENTAVQQIATRALESINADARKSSANILLKDLQMQ